MLPLIRCPRKPVSKRGRNDGREPVNLKGLRHWLCSSRWLLRESQRRGRMYRHSPWCDHCFRSPKPQRHLAAPSVFSGLVFQRIAPPDRITQLTLGWRPMIDANPFSHRRGGRLDTAAFTVNAHFLCNCGNPGRIHRQRPPSTGLTHCRNGNKDARTVRCALVVGGKSEQPEIGASPLLLAYGWWQELAMSTLRQLRARSIWARQDSWIFSASSAQIILLAAFAGFAVFGTAAMWGWIASREGWSLLPMALVSDAVAGALSGTFIFVLLQNTRERRLAMLRRLRAIREMNHEIRNALELIQLSAYSTHHQQSIATITNAVDRIQWTLREISSPTKDAAETTSGYDQAP